MTVIIITEFQFFKSQPTYNQPKSKTKTFHYKDRRDIVVQHNLTTIHMKLGKNVCRILLNLWLHLTKSRFVQIASSHERYVYVANIVIKGHWIRQVCQEL